MKFRKSPLAVWLLTLSLWLIIGKVPSYAWGPAVDYKARGLAHYMMGVYYELNGQNTEAIGEYQKSIKANGKQIVPRLKLAAYYLRLDKLALAQIQLKRVIRLNPQNSQAHYWLALIYSAQHHDDRAQAEYEKVLKINPDAIDMLFLLGSHYADNHQRPQAITVFRHLLKLQPENDEALNSLGYLYAEEGTHLDEAQRLTERAISKDPHNGAYWDSLGWVYYKKGMYQESVKALLKAAAYLQDPLIYEHLSDVYKAMGDLSHARQWQEKSRKFESKP